MCKVRPKNREGVSYPQTPWEVAGARTREEEAIRSDTRRWEKHFKTEAFPNAEKVGEDFFLGGTQERGRFS